MPENKRKNKFIKIRHHLRSTQIDEKLERLNEAIPTNNTTSIYFIEPEKTEITPAVYREGLNLTADSNPAGTDTSGLFNNAGEILTEQPPGDNSYILGPMVSVYFPDGDYTAIGYIQKDTRKVINLARLSGSLTDWNGVDGFVSYSQLTLAQAVWYWQQFKSNKVQDYRVFYIGIFEPIPASEKGRSVTDPSTGVDIDELGRWNGKIINQPYVLEPEKTNTEPAKYAGPDPNLVPGSANPNIAQISDRQERKELQMLLKGFIRGDYGKGPDIDRQIRNIEIKLYGIPIRGADAGTGEDIQIAGNPATGGQPGYGGDYTNVPSAAERSKFNMTWDKHMKMWVPNLGIEKIKGVSNPSKSNTQVASYQPQGKLISEDRKRILHNIKKPVSVPNEKKEKIKHRPRVIGSGPRTIGTDLMKQAEVPTSFKKPEERMWGKYEQNQNARMTQERKNMILDTVGTSDHAWEWLTEKNKVKSKNIMYGNFDVEKNFGKESASVKDKIISKEQIGGDYIVKLMDDDGKIITMTQSVLNERLHKEFEQKMLEQQTMQADKDPLFKRVSNIIKPVIDYPDKPSKLGYPDSPPPETINGWHPEYGGKVDYYKKLDNKSADTMSIPQTDNPEINKEVEKQTTKNLSSKVKKYMRKNK